MNASKNIYCKREKAAATPAATKDFEKEGISMAKNNQSSVPGAQGALDRFKMEAAAD